MRTCPECNNKPIIKHSTTTSYSRTFKSNDTDHYEISCCSSPIFCSFKDWDDYCDKELENYLEESGLREETELAQKEVTEDLLRMKGLM